MQSEGVSKYELNIPRYKELLNILKQRKALVKAYYNRPIPKGRRMTQAEKRANDLPENRVYYNRPKLKRFELNRQKYLSKRAWFHEKLNKEFEYYKLITFHNPNEPASKEGFPFFDLRYVLRQDDIKKWVKVVQLELEYSVDFDSTPKRGQPKKALIYTRAVFWTYLKHLAYAMENRNKPEITRNPSHWATERTIEQFPDNKIEAAQLIKMGKIFLSEQRKQNKHWEPKHLSKLVLEQGAF